MLAAPPRAPSTGEPAAARGHRSPGGTATGTLDGGARRRAPSASRRLKFPVDEDTAGDVKKSRRELVRWRSCGHG